MKFGITHWSVVVALLAAAASAPAQVVDVEAGGGAASLDLIFNLDLEQSITLELTDNGASPSTQFSNVVQGQSASIDFGLVNTECTLPPATGSCYRLADGTGARFVGTIDVKVTSSGQPNATYDLGIEAVQSPGVNARLYRACGVNGTCPPSEQDSYWELPGNGQQIPDLGSSSGTELGSAHPSGGIIEHQIAIEVLDSQGPGPLSVTVVYTAWPGSGPTGVFN